MTDGDPDVMPSLWHQQQHAMIDAEAKRHAIDARRVFAAAKSLVLGRVRNELLDQRRALDSLRRVYRKTSAAYFRIPCTTMEAWANYGAEKETHNVKVSPAAMPTAVKKSAPPIAAKARLQAPPGRSDRFAAIEAAAARRDDAKRERSERARSFIRSSGGRSRRASGAVDPDDDEEGALTAGGLPAPTASFDL